MSKVLNMVQNENMKIYRRPRTWIMFGLVIFFIGFINFMMSNFGGNPLPRMDALLMSAEFISFVAMFCAIVAGDSVSSEFGWGTIKLLLIRPINRSKVLLAKYIAVLIFTVFVLLIMVLAAYVFGLLFYDVGNSSTSFADVFTAYAYKLPDLLFGFTIAFMISAIFRSSALAIGVSIFLMAVGKDLVVGLLSQYDWSKYVLYMNTNLEQYSNGRPPIIEGMSMSFSITMLVIYYVVFMGLTWWVFNKRDVTN